MNWNKIKEEAVSLAIQQASERLDALRAEMDALNTSSEADTKSSMGDKYETGREMIQQERGKIAMQLAECEKQLQMLSAITEKGVEAYKSVEAGSLVVTEKANYLISVAIGLIKSSETVFFLSPLAPIGQQLLGKKEGDQVIFNGQSITIKQII